MSDNTPACTSALRRVPGVFVVQVLLLALIVAGICAFRAATSRHYGRLQVEFFEYPAVDPGVAVFAMSSNGVLLPLQQRPEDPRAWGLDVRWPSVRSLVVAGRELMPAQLSALRVLLGASRIHAESLQVTSIRRLPSEGAVATELRSRFGFSEIYEIIPEPRYLHPLVGHADCVNWLGTPSLIWLAVIQGVATLLGLRFLKMSLGRIFALYRSSAADSGTEGVASKTLTEFIRLIMFISGAHLCWCWLKVVLTMTAPGDLMLGTVIALAVALLIAGWCLFVQRTKSARRLKLAMTTVTAIVFALKLCWLSTVEFRPFSDYGEYHRYGAQLAAGDWNSIRKSTISSAAIYLRRAAAFALPISRFVGTSMSDYEVVNVLVQATTILMLSVLISRMSGLRVAAFSLPFLLVYPELWYLTGVVTHNIPGYFWMVATWLAVDEFQRRAVEQQNRGNSWLKLGAVTVFTGVIAGILLSMLELSKSYGSLFLIGLAVCMLLGPYLPGSLVSRGQWQRIPGGQRLAFFLTLLITEQYFVGSADRILQNKSGLRLPPYGYINYAAAVDPSTNASGDSVFIWLHYAYSVDLKRMPWVAARKILHEKLGTGFEFIRGLFRKNEVLARAADSMSLVQDNLRLPNADARPENVPYGLLQYALSHWIAFLVGVMFLLRLLLPGPLVQSAGELFPLVSVLTVMLAVYLVTEAHPYYSQNLIFLFCWSAGTSVERLLSCQGLRSARLLDSIRPFWPLPRCFAAMSLAAAIAVFCLVGFAVDHSGLTFHRIARSGELQIDLDGMAAPVSQQRGPVRSGISRVHCWVEFSSAGGGPVKGLVASGNFEVQSEAGPLKGLRFFVSGNQRDRQRRIKDAWKDLPIRYSIAVNGRRFLENRPIEELATPRYVQLPAKFWLDDQPATESKAIVTITLECTDDVKIGGVSPPPAIALEYFH